MHLHQSQIRRLLNDLSGSIAMSDVIRDDVNHPVAGAVHAQNPASIDRPAHVPPSLRVSMPIERPRHEDEYSTENCVRKVWRTNAAQVSHAASVASLPFMVDSGNATHWPSASTQAR